MQTTQALWAEQNRHPGDRLHLFSAVAAAVTTCSGSTPSTARVTR